MLKPRSAVGGCAKSGALPPRSQPIINQEEVKRLPLPGRSPLLPRGGTGPKVRSPCYLQLKPTVPPSTYSALIKILKKAQSALLVPPLAS